MIRDTGRHRAIARLEAVPDSYRTWQKELPHVSVLVAMPSETPRLPRLAGTLMVLSTLLLGGCPWRNQSPDAIAMLPTGELAVPASRVPSGPETAVPSSGLAEVLRIDAWRAVPQDQQSQPPALRWRHERLEELLASPGNPRPDLQHALAGSDPVGVANAAISLARLGDVHCGERLAAAVETPTLSPAIRCAAAEALAGLRPARVDLLEKLLGQYGRHKQDNGSRYLPELHVELVRGLARHVSPSEEPLLIAALRNPSAEVRLEALSAWNTHREADVPVEVADLRSDPEPRVRAAVLPILGRSGRPQAEDHLVSALDDNDLRVRLAAVAALGELQSERAGARLEALLAHPSELVRAAAVASLTSMGNEKTVLGAAGDKSWRVRLAVAEALGRFSSRGAAASAITMLDDPSAPVQQQVVESIAEWPIAQSGPVLLEAMGRNVYVTRKAAAEQLARRWEPAGQFPVDGPPERRKAVLEQLQQQFRQQVGFAAPTAHSGPTPPAASTNAELAVRVEQLVEQLRDGTWPPDSHARAVADLQRLGPDVVGSIEHVALKQQKSLPDAVYREVLPPLSPAFAALDRMTSADVGERRRAAGELAELAAKQPLGRLATARLAELATAETDALVWQSMLTAVADDGGEPAVRLAAIAIGHAAPEVRRRACEHLAVHPAQGNAALLAPALEDRHDAVAAAAAAAMGQLGQVNDTGPLRRLLASAGETVRLEAAVSLARLGDDAGRAELERLSYSSDEKVRRRVATAMGEVPDRSFVPSLIRLLDDRHSTRVAALASLPKVVGHDVAGSPGDPRPRMTEHIEAWKRWHAEQPAGSKP